MPRSTLILIAVVLVILGTAGYLLFGRSDTSSAVSSDGAPATSAELTFVALIAQIEPITFDASIINDPRFTALRDIRTAIVAEPAGRVDPFAPLGR